MSISRISTIEVEMDSLSEINSSYKEAIRKYNDQNDGADIWKAKIQLRHIDFQKNYRREIYTCIFEIVEEGY